ncbi:inovirus Gp2 family protein, partial [Escherichia coli]|nr:inovirus Gp2 family protein [Escherichia coli]
MTITSIKCWHVIPACELYGWISSTEKDTPDFLQPDHRWLELQLRMMLEQVEQFENIVGFFWVIEWTADHGFHAHAVFWIDRQRVKKIYPFAERITECWRSITHNSGS